MQIQTPIVTMIAKGTWCINEYGMDAMFLLEGAHKALLIDTGTGTFDVAALVRSITEKPLRVVCTHGHVDHVGGIGFFDEVWLHPDDFEMARTLTREQRQGYVTIMNGMSGGLFSVTEEDVKGFDKLPQLKPLHEGDILDLGGGRSSSTRPPAIPPAASPSSTSGSGSSSPATPATEIPSSPPPARKSRSRGWIPCWPPRRNSVPSNPITTGITTGISAMPQTSTACRCRLPSTRTRLMSAKGF